MELKSMIKKNWMVIAFFLSVIGYILFITTEINKSAEKPENKPVEKVEKQKPQEGPKFSVDAYVENSKEEICGDLFEDVEFSYEEAKSLQALSKITTKKLKEGHKLRGPAETEHSYENGKYITLYSQGFVRRTEPTRKHIIMMLNSAFRKNEFSEQDISNIADKLVELRKECKPKKSSK